MDKENQSLQQQFNIGVFGIIFDKSKKVLLCHRTDYDLWNLPGGKLESEETPWDGVIREVKEETGLDVIVSKVIGIYSKPHKNEIVFSFMCERIGGELLLNNEASDIRYFDIDKLPENLPLKHRERIIDAYDNNPEIILKVQEGESTLEGLKKS
jgi:8-oxo-dGTP diphosphatase